MDKKYRAFGKYQIIEELGRGGMGVVYKAYDTKLKSYVALKMILNAAQEKLERFFAETIAIAKLNHLNIVRFYEYGEQPCPHFTMEYIEGHTLAELIKNKKIIPQQLVDMLIAICDAMHYSHRNKIMHRDIKPSNIMITKSDIPKIMDFGLAKRENKTQISKSGQMLGTLAYMPPEQVKGKAVYQSDIYSLGAAMYEALTFRTVFQGALEVNIVVQIMSSPPLNLRQLNPDICTYLEAICLKCLHKNPQKRYKNFKQLSKELNNYKEHRPIIARRYSFLDVMTNFFNKHKTICFSIVVVFIALLVSLIITLQALSLAEDERRKAKRTLNKTMKVIEYSLYEYEEIQQDKHFASLCGNIFEYVENYGENRDWSFIKGYVSGTSGDLHASLKYYSRQIQINPANELAYNNRGRVYADMKQYEKALADYNKTISIKPKRYTVYCDRGSLYGRMEIDDKALLDFSKAISLNSGCYNAYINRGIIYKNMKQYKKALTDYNKAIYIKPKDYNGYYSRGLLYDKIDKYERAVSDYSKAIILAPENYKIYNTRAMLYQAKKQYKKALADYSKAIFINSKYSVGHYNRADLYLEMQKNKEALDDYNKAITLNSEYYSAYINRGVLYMEMKEYQKALEDYSKSIAINPNRALGYYNRADFYTETKQYSKALLDYDKVIAIEPQNDEAYRQRGDIYLDKKQYKKALKDFKKMLPISPLKAHKRLYSVYTKLGDDRKAQYHFLQMKKNKAE